MLKIIDPGLKFRGTLSKRSITKYIVLHHAEAFNASVFDVHKWHLANGWAGIGYNYYVRKDGTIYQGRPEDAIGSHSKGSNSCSIGICCEGNFDDSNPRIRCDKSMPEKQYNALVELIEDIKRRYCGVEVKGHGELYPTACPGKYYPLGRLKAAFNKVTKPPETKCGIDLDTNAGIQTALNKLGYNCGVVDGIVGEKTIEAIKAFQGANGLVVDGIVGPMTKWKLLELTSK